ncbi:MAG: hypothetical protein KDK36_04265 [Leptospiraceae bacterium]|nr:hypothetical protein [Leptospiraceae bacterium]
MFQTTKKIILLGLILLISVNCNLISNTSEDNLKNERTNLQALVLGQQQTITSEAASLFSLNGTYSSFTGNGTTSTTTTYIIAKTGLSGVWLDDASTYSSCYLIVEFTSGIIYTQNPSNYGACFASDSNKGKFNKILYFANTSKSNSYYYCSVAFGKASLSEAKADTTTADATNITSGCNGFAWSRIDKK